LFCFLLRIESREVSKRFFSNRTIGPEARVKLVCWRGNNCEIDRRGTAERAEKQINQVRMNPIIYSFIDIRGIELWYSL